MGVQNQIPQPHHVAGDVPVAQPIVTDSEDEDSGPDEERKEERVFGTNLSNQVSGMAARARARHAKKHPNVIRNENQEMM